MPGYDGTGPRGEGPMTGWGRGYCKPGFRGGYVLPVFFVPRGAGRGFPPWGGGRGRVFGGGRGLRGGFGRGYGFRPGLGYNLAYASEQEVRESSFLERIAQVIGDAVKSGVKEALKSKDKPQE